MSDIQLYLVEAGKHPDEARAIAKASATKLEQKQISLLELVDSLNEYINNEDASLRSHTIGYLADILDQLPNKVLSLQHRALLTSFVLSRIQDDSEAIAPSARALMALERLGKWTSETAKEIITALMDSTYPLKQFKLQSERYSLLQLIDLLLAKHRQAVSERAEGDYDFISKFTTYFEGEKDPRNLMLVFSIVMVPMTEWNLGPSTQDMFELVFNYFPITFKPPPGDPFGITAQDLKDRLRACIASTSDFAPYSFPALLDKLDSTSMNTKRDVLDAIVSCINQYEPTTISLYSVTLWDALKFEILNVQEEDLAQKSLEALGDISKRLAMATENALNAYLKPIVKECTEHLEDAPTKQSEAAGRILYSIASSSPNVTDMVIKGVLPVMLTLFQASESIVKRRGLIEVLNKLLQAVRHVSSDWMIKDEDGIIKLDRADSHALKAFTDDIVALLLQAVVSAPKTEISFRLFSLQALENMLQTRQLLTAETTQRILSASTDIIIHESETQQDEIIAAAVKVIIAAAQQHPEVAVGKALPALVAELPDSPEPGLFNYEPALEVLAKLSTAPELADTIIIRLKNKLEVAKRQEAPGSYILALLAALLYVFTYGSPSKEDGCLRVSYLTDLALPWLEEALGLGSTKQSSLGTEACIDIISRICNIVLRDQSQHTQNQVYSSLEKIFNELQKNQGTTEADVQGKTSSALSVVASLYLHAAFKSGIYPSAYPDQILTTLIDVAHDGSQTAVVHSSSLRHITLVINKFIPVSEREQTLSRLVPNCLTIAEAAKDSFDVEVAFAIVKSLIVQNKNAVLANRLLQQLLKLLSSENVGTTAAHGVGQIFAPDELLSKSQHCNVSGLFKQRTYNVCVNTIADDIKTCPPAVKRNYLAALSAMLKNIPYDVVKPTLSRVIPLLLQTLDLEERGKQRCKPSTLITIEAILLHDSDMLAEHAGSLISRLVNCTDAIKNDEEIRAGSLKCLKLIPTQIKRETVLPYRKQVVKKLQVGLDDKKRTVRAEAVRCRTAWLNLDQDDEDE